MALRLSFAAVVVAFAFVACGDSTHSSASSGGTSSTGVSSGAPGSAGGGALGSGGGAGASSGGVGTSLGGTSGTSAGGAVNVGGVREQGGAGQSATAGRGGTRTSGGTAANGGSAGTDLGGSSLGGENTNGGASESGDSGGAGLGGVAAGGTNAPGSGGQVGGIPTGWLVADGVDPSIIPGPNFDTVREMFAGVPCYGSNCHNGGRNHLQVNKTPDELYRYMINFTTLECGKLINTANPSDSALVKYLRGPCGSIQRMPAPNCQDDAPEWCIPEYYIQAIEEWIADGAPR